MVISQIFPLNGRGNEGELRQNGMYIRKFIHSLQDNAVGTGTVIILNR
jgi:hypothetical protein